MTDYTPGPWFVIVLPDGRIHICTRDRRVFFDGAYHQLTRADARLIAQAPVLLEGLKELVAVAAEDVLYTHGDKLSTKAQDALAEAIKDANKVIREAEHGT